MKPRFMTASEAVDLIPDGATIATDGFTMMGVAEAVLAALETRFISTGSPKDLVVVHAAGQSDRVRGFEHFAVPGMVRRVIGSHWGLMPRMSAFLGESQAECVCLPQGQIAATFRATAARRPGHLSRIGLGTFVDPRLGGGKVNDAAKTFSPDYVESVSLAGREWLMYKSIPVDVAIIRATQVDSDGNASQDEEAVWLDTLAIAQAARASGGIVICQAKRIVPAASISPRRVTIPGCMIDVVVPVADPGQAHRQTAGTEFDSAYVSSRPLVSTPENTPSDVSYSARLAIARRAVRYLREFDVVNLGTGIPGDAVGPALAEIGQQDGVLLTLESGVYGGIPAGGVDFGISSYPSAIIPQSSQFDFYNGGGLDVAIMGMGQVDADGNVNVSSLGGKRIGCGGFIDITQSAKTVLFCFPFDSKFPKFVERIDEVSFSASQARSLGQEIYFISDKAVFSLAPEGGLHLDEVAPSTTVEEILKSIPFEVSVPDVVPTMDPTLFLSRPSAWTLPPSRSEDF